MTDMTVTEFLERIAEKVPGKMPEVDSDIWVTKARGDYIAHCGMEDKSVLPFLLEHGATEHVSSIWDAGKPICLAFSPREKKWYGWSHRAICDFAVGSECKKGDCHYRPTDKDDFLAHCIRFWSGDDRMNLRAWHTDKGVQVEWDYSLTVPNKKLRGQIVGTICRYPEQYGRGEWVAQSLADARQMAIDFVEGVA